MEFSTADIRNMPMKEKLLLLERVIDAIATEQQDYPPPDSGFNLDDVNTKFSK